MKKSDIYKIIFVSYGLDNFDKGLFKEPTFDIDINKPRGGFWGSPINSNSSWGEWCKNNEFNIKSLDKHILFKVKKGSEICIIDNELDLMGHSRNIPRYYYRRDDMIQDLKSKYPNAHRYEIEKAVDDYLKRDSKNVLDFDFLKRYYDGIFVSANAVHKLRHVSNGDGLYWWDVESICIFNPDAIEIIPENAFEKAKVPSYEDGDGFISDDEYKKSKENRHHGYDDNYDDNYNDIRMDYKQKQINKAYELYGNRNIDSDSSKLFNGEHPGILAQGHGNNKNTKLAKKYNGTIKSGLDENKKGRKNTINMSKIQISENDIRQMVNESVKKILNEEKSYPCDIDLISDMRNDFQWKLQQFKQEIEKWMKRDGYDIYFDEEFFKKISKACSTIFDEYILKKE